MDDRPTNTSQTLDLFKSREYSELVSRVHECRQCERMECSARVLGWANGDLNAKIMFIGEAPGRLGADLSEIPFHGDKSGDNFERLLNQVGISRYEIFVTNSVLCNPKDEKGNNAPPKIGEINNCSRHLIAQIDLIDPKLVVTLGSKPLQALSFIERHELSLRQHVRTKHDWYDRILIPAYHPGQRAMIHRSFANQLSDYQYISEQLGKIGKRAQQKFSRSDQTAIWIAGEILSRIPSLTYFALHKMFYLVEYEYFKKYNTRPTGSYLVRQKDGPYYVDLHISKLKKNLENLKVANRKNKLVLSVNGPDFVDYLQRKDGIDMELPELYPIIDATVRKYETASDEKMKSAVYMTRPIRNILKRERSGELLYNTPIEF